MTRRPLTVAQGHAVRPLVVSKLAVVSMTSNFLAWPNGSPKPAHGAWALESHRAAINPGSMSSSRESAGRVVRLCVLLGRPDPTASPLQISTCALADDLVHPPRWPSRTHPMACSPPAGPGCG